MLSELREQFVEIQSVHVGKHAFMNHPQDIGMLTK